jgi:hypothetical protein
MSDTTMIEFEYVMNVTNDNIDEVIYEYIED